MERTLPQMPLISFWNFKVRLGLQRTPGSFLRFSPLGHVSDLDWLPHSLCPPFCNPQRRSLLSFPLSKDSTLSSPFPHWKYSAVARSIPIPQHTIDRLKQMPGLFSFKVSVADTCMWFWKWQQKRGYPFYFPLTSQELLLCIWPDF